MTPRLRILSIGLALSLGYAIYDYIGRNSNKKSKINKTKVVKKRPSTARVSMTRASKIREKSSAKKENNNKENFTPNKEFLPISDDLAMLEGWSRNPFVEVYKPPAVTQTKAETQTKIDQAIVEKPIFTSLDGLIIETAIRMGDKAYVTINGQTFTEGDLINDALIEKIENEQITFKVGKTRIIKDVGT